MLPIDAERKFAMKIRIKNYHIIYSEIVRRRAETTALCTYRRRVVINNINSLL